MANDLINQTAQEAYHDYVASPGISSKDPNNPPDDWWEKVKRWITNHLKPLVPAAELARSVAQVIDILKSWFSRK